MAKVLLSAAANIEYIPEELALARSIGANVEYVGDTNYLRLGSSALMVEYRASEPVKPTVRVVKAVATLYTPNAPFEMFDPDLGNIRLLGLHITPAALQTNVDNPQFKFFYYIANPGGGIYKCKVSTEPVLYGNGKFYDMSYVYTCNMPNETPSTYEYCDLTHKETMLYAAMNGKVYVRDAAMMSMGTWELLADFTDEVVPKISLAISDAGTLVVAATYSGGTVYDHCKISTIDGSSVDVWPGFLPKVSHQTHITAQELDGTLHIYVDDWSKHRPVHISRAEGGLWSSSELIIPTDALDEESSFGVGYASVIDGKLYLSGMLKRQYGDWYVTQMQGPDNFTFGRDMIIAANVCERVKILKSVGGTYVPDGVYAVGGARVFYNTKTAYLYDIYEATYDLPLHSFSASFSINASDKLSIDVPLGFADEHPNDLIPGARFDLATYINDKKVFLRSYTIESVRRQYDANGQSCSVGLASYAMKKLMDWQSDTFFDYIGQAETHGDPGDLTKLVHVSGSSFERPEDGGLIMQSLNDDGILYTTISASRGGFIRCKFSNVQTTSTMVGVGLNYGEETLAQSADRLGIEISDVSAADRGRWGLFAIYYPDPEDQSVAQVWFADYNTIREAQYVVGNCESQDTLIASDPWRIIAKASLPRFSSFTLAMRYQDGRARIYYASGDNTALDLVLDSEGLYEPDTFDSEHEDYGRGALYFCNNSGVHAAFPMSSDCDVIPLHRTSEKYAISGVPLEDRVDKFPSSDGVVVIDSERIGYEGLAGWGTTDAEKITCPLTWVPGEIMSGCGDGETDPGGTDTMFAQYRGSRGVSPHVHGNNYLLQQIVLQEGISINAVRIWLKKVNFPEDGVELTIGYGNSSSGAELGNVVNTVVATGKLGAGSSITEEGGWVTYLLDKDVVVSNYAGDGLWVVLKRTKNWNHPSSTAYFECRMREDSCSGGSAWIFCEEDDAAVPLYQDMALVVYGKPEGVNLEYCIPVKYESGRGLPTSDPGSYWTGCALVITEGAGAGNCYRIVRSARYTSSLSDLYLFFVDRNPGNIFDAGTKLRAVPSFYGLTRGESSTYASAHAADSLVHLPMGSFAEASYFEYFTANENLSLAEVGRSIVRKAGADCDIYHVRGVGYGTLYTNLLRSANFVFRLTAYPDAEQCSASDHADVYLISTSEANYETPASYVARAYINLLENNKNYLYLVSGNKSLKIQTDGLLRGSYRITFADGTLSVWSGGWLIGALCGEIPTGNDYVLCTLPGDNASISLFLPEAKSRVDNFAMDMGKSGTQLLQSLINEKRVFFREGEKRDVRIHVFRRGSLDLYARQDIYCYAEDEQDDNGYLYGYEDLSEYSAANMIGAEVSDAGMATRVLLEGGEIVEAYDGDAMAVYGNLFRSFNFNEINNLLDAKYFANLVLEDMVLNKNPVEISGSVDPAIRPTDLVSVVFPDGSTKVVVVDSVSHVMNINEADAVYDMRITGRQKES